MPNQAQSDLLTPEVEQQICAFIRQGAYDWVAAEAAGVPRDLFEKWLRFGASKRPREKFKQFLRRVRQARAQARLFAETEARGKDVKFWLRCGPGREAPDRPGWSQEVKPLVAQTVQQINLLASPEWNSLWQLILHALAEFPEARAALADALASKHNKLLPPPAKAGG